VITPNAVPQLRDARALIVLSCLTVPTAPQDGQAGGGVDLIELSGMGAGRSYHQLNRR
jgi:hypothetical protein